MLFRSDYCAVFRSFTAKRTWKVIRRSTGVEISTPRAGTLVEGNSYMRKIKAPRGRLTEKAARRKGPPKATASPGKRMLAYLWARSMLLSQRCATCPWIALDWRRPVRCVGHKSTERLQERIVRVLQQRLAPESRCGVAHAVLVEGHSCPCNTQGPSA